MRDSDDLADFERRRVEHDGDGFDAYVAGSGPAVLVLPEMPGITPEVARFARWVRDAGLTAWLPSLFGTDGARASMEAAIESMGAPCVQREFTSFAQGDDSPMTNWLRHLARVAHDECGGPGVGVIGMCFTGNFALAMSIDPTVLAPVMSQPSLPLDDPAGTFIRPDELRRIRSRLDRDDVNVRAYRFEGDTYCQRARFDSLAAALGDRFVPTVLPDTTAGDVGWIGVPHSVVTTSLVDLDGELTAAVRDDIIEHFRRTLRAVPG